MNEWRKIRTRLVDKSKEKQNIFTVDVCMEKYSPDQGRIPGDIYTSQLGSNEQKYLNVLQMMIPLLAPITSFLTSVVKAIECFRHAQKDKNLD